MTSRVGVAVVSRTDAAARIAYCRLGENFLVASGDFLEHLEGFAMSSDGEFHQVAVVNRE